jgi:branched-chain amino acid transport system permease protein
VDRFIALVAAGVAQGSVAALIALGIVLLHKATGIVNFAQGDLLTLGAYLAVWFIVDHNMPTLLGYALTLVLAFFVGVAIERVGYAPLRRQPILAVVISTFALALGLRSLLILWLGSDLRTLPAPLGAGKVWRIGGAAIPYQTILIAIVMLVLLAALELLLHRTSIGRQVRALAADRETALLQGIRVNRLSMLMFGLSAALAALGGLLVAPMLTVGPELGFTLLLTSFAALVLGGFDNVGGTVAAAVGISIVQQLLAGYVSPDYIEAYPYIILLVALILRPHGLIRETTRVRY